MQALPPRHHANYPSPGGQAARTVRDCRPTHLIPAPLLTPTAHPDVHIHVSCINAPDHWLVCAPPLSLPPPDKNVAVRPHCVFMPAVRSCTATPAPTPREGRPKRHMRAITSTYNDGETCQTRPKPHRVGARCQYVAMPHPQHSAVLVLDIDIPATPPAGAARGSGRRPTPC